MSGASEHPIEYPDPWMISGAADTALSSSEKTTPRSAEAINPASVACGRLSSLGTLDLAAGADNLLQHCVGVRPGERLLLVREDSCHGFYDCSAAAFVADRARMMEIVVEEIEAGAPGAGRGLPPEIERAMVTIDHAVFFARIGDQLRFDQMPGACSKTVSYAYDAACLGSLFGTTPYRLMLDLKALVDQRVAGAGEIRVTCPLGTDLVGTPLGMTADPNDGEVMVRRFPLTVFKPVPAVGFSGRVALSRWLLGTGAHYYEPYSVRLDNTVFALIDHGRIVDFEGPGSTIDQVRSHHRRIGSMFGIEPFSVHSWHAGIHPRTFYPLPAAHNPARWSALAFGSPRYLHFHVCGDVPPGEISWTVIDPTVTLDGKPAWKEGRLVLADTDAAKAILTRYPGGVDIFAGPDMEIGL